MSKRKLDTYLEKLGSSAEKLEKVEEIKIFDAIRQIVFKPIRGVEILGIIQDDRKRHIQTMSYYTVTPGFTVKEFYSYLENLRKGNDPRPFSRYFPRLEISFVNYRRYSLGEVTDGVTLFKEDGLIKVTESLFPGETRYDISNESLRNLAREVCFINIINFNLLIGRLLFKGRPAESDKYYLASFLGKWAADRTIASAYHIRQSHKDKVSGKEQKFMRMLETYKSSFIERIKETYKELINEDEVASKLVEGISSSPLR